MTQKIHIKDVTTKDESKHQSINNMPEYNPKAVPQYLKSVYNWAYLDPKSIKRLDHQWIVWVLLFLNAGRLMNRYLDQVEPGMKVWQVAHVYGTLVQKVAKKCGESGEFHLTDCTPGQLSQAYAKLAPFKNSHITQSDAADFDHPETFDLVCSFMLLHEVPSDKKRAVVDRMLQNMKPGGKAIFVDYHKPKWYWQPFRAILQLVNRTLEPFSNEIWENEIESFATHKAQYHWQKESIFGGVYQCVIATKKSQQD